MSALDFSGKQQLYYQLYDILFQDIVNNIYAIGDLIPSESELMRQYNVSRATARRAMEMLANNGLIQKQRGRGSEVISNRPSTSPQRVASYIKKSVPDKAVPEKRLIDAQVLPAPADVSQALGLTSQASVYRLRRLRYSGDDPFYLEVNYFEQGFLPGVMDRNFSHESLRAFISTECHILWSRAEQSIYAIDADHETADFLNVAEGTSLLYIQRVSYDSENRPREFVNTYYRSDIYHLEIELDI